MPVCHGNNEFHCCWIGGQQCPHLEQNTVAGRRWACGLLREFETWGNVYRTVAYQRTAAATYFDCEYPGFGCGDWPQNIPGALDSATGLCCWGDA